ncbi:MAG: MoaD/ThiS family protein [Gemmatimonadetes bacterium]|nr:MoaD/ThiS family protein [Gemmatimonadota bacterium]
MLLFASYAEALGGSSVRVTLDEGAAVSDLLATVRDLAPPGSLPPAMVAVNHEYAPPSRLLSGSDEVAIIPPVAGG